MDQDTFKRKLTTVLSADAVGYSILMGEDEAATVKTITAYQNVMTELIMQHRGRVIDSPGDNLLAEFGSVVDAYMNLGKTLNFSGRSEEALPVLKKALRLNPFPRVGYFVLLGAVYRNTGRYEEAIAMFKKAIKMSPDHLSAHRNLAATYIYLGREEEARAEAAEVLRINPKFSLERYATRNPQKNKAAFELFIDALRKAGLPD